MPTLDAHSLLSDPAPIWFDESVAGLVPAAAPFDPLQAALAMVEAQGQRPALAVVPPPAADPLAQALPWLVRHLGVAAAVEAVVGPVDDEQPAASDDVLPALRRIGFDAHLQRRSLASFGKADLPTILLLHSGDACVLTERWRDDHGQDQCNLVLPGPQPDEFSTAQAEIEAEYSGVALVVSRPARPPFASALARARAGQAGAGAAAQLPADAPPMRHADALVALAAAVQGAQRAMHASRADAGHADIADSADSAGQAVLAAHRPAPHAEPAEPAPALTRRPRPPEPALAGPQAADDSPAAVLKLSFMQADKAVLTPGQALARIAHDARALVQITLAPLGHRLLAAARTLARGGRRAGGQWAAAARSAAAAVRRLARQSAQGPGQQALRRLRLLAFRLRQQGLAWRQRQRLRQHHRLALLALGRAGQPAVPAQARPAEPTLRVAAPSHPVPQVAGLAPRAAVQTRLAGAARWPELGPAAQRLAGAVSRYPLTWLPGLAAASVLCLLVGAPLAWAGMVSHSSRQAWQAAPSLLRAAFGANLDQAGQTLVAQGRAQRVAVRNRLDAELGQPLLAADPAGRSADPAGPAAETPRPVAAMLRRDSPGRGQAGKTGQGSGLNLARASVPAVRGRGLPRRARHVCR